MRKIILSILILAAFTSNAQDLVSGGDNSWIFHTPDDGRKTLYIAPLTNGNWQWGHFSLSDDGTFYSTKLSTSAIDISGTLQTINGGATWDNLRIWSDGVSSHIQSNGDEHGLVLKSQGGNKILLMSNVGIGTLNPSPDSKLTVKGKIHAEEVKADLAVPGPDYVFEKSYALKSLADVETFISQNKHLPEIPSAKTMKEEGINVGDMQMKLLQKIEEITLYLIEMKNENTKLKDRVKELENKR